MYLGSVTFCEYYCNIPHLLSEIIQQKLQSLLLKIWKLYPTLISSFSGISYLLRSIYLRKFLIIRELKSWMSMSLRTAWLSKRNVPVHSNDEIDVEECHRQTVYSFTRSMANCYLLCTAYFFVTSYANNSHLEKLTSLKSFNFSTRDAF